MRNKIYFLSIAAIGIISFTFLFNYLSSSAQNENIVTEEKRADYEKFLANHAYNQRFTEEQLNAIPKADRPDLAYEQDFLATLDPSTGKPEVDRLYPIFAMTKNLQQTAARAPGSSSTPWVERGPDNVGGRTRALAWDPVSANKVWAGGVSGGLWYNTNITSSSNSWQSVNDFWDNIAVTAIVFDPNNNNNIYVATGESYTNANRGAGIWKSINGGTSFTQLSSTSSFYYINDMVIRNENGTSVIYAAVAGSYYQGIWHGTANEGLQRSTNGGTSWTQVMPNISGSAVRPTDIDIAGDNKLWVGCDHNAYGDGGGQIYSSSNGVTWSSKYSHSNKGRVNLACAPSNSSYVYALFEYNGELDAVKMTSNGGTTWSTKTEPNDADPGIPSTDFTRGQAWYDLTIDVDPLNVNTLMVGGIDLFKSTNGATSWSQISHWYGGYTYQNVHADQHAIVYKDGSSSKVVFGNDGGVAYSGTANNTTPTVSHRNEDYNVTQYYACAIHPTSGSNYFLAGSQDNGTQQYSTSGMNSTTEATGGDGAYTHIDQTNGNYQTTAYVYNSFYHSSNGGTSFSRINNDQNTGRFINPSDLDDNQNILYTYKTLTSLYRVTGFQTSSPTVATLNITSMLSSASCLKVSPFTTTSSKLFIGTSGGRLYKISNANSTPTKTEITGSSFPTGSISSIEFGQTESQMIVTFSNYGVTSIWYTVNGGTSWVSKEGNLPDMPVRWALFNPLNFNEVIIATEVGVWSTSTFSSSAPSWAASNSGLANVRVDMLQTRSSDNEVIAATHGRGLFSSSFSSGGSGGSSYCAATSTTTPCREYISNVTIGTINNSTACGFYSDYSSQSTSVAAGATVPVTITSAVVNSTYVGYIDDQVAVWVDWNNDSDFVDTGEDVYVVTFSATTTFPLTFNITVPSGVNTGDVRMRTRMSFLTDDGQITPCGNSTRGEVEDYTLSLVGTTPSYCAATSTSIPCDEYISNVTVGTINNSTACGNYSDYSSQIANVTKGATVPMTVSTAIVGGTNAGYTDDQLAVWVDWNNDLDFTDTGEEVYLTTYSSTTSFPLSISLNVPSNATTGNVRMRVRMSYLTVDGQIVPCGNSAWGEVEDYTLNVQDPASITWTNQPRTRNIECSDSSNPNATGTPTASSTCSSGGVSINYSDNTASGNCANASIITRTWTATDNCGGSTSYNQTINITDNTDPVITCPPAQTIISSNGSNAPIPDYTGMATATDNCTSSGNIMFSQSPAVGTIKILGTTSITLTAMDECGNTVNCSFNAEIKNSTGVNDLGLTNITVFPNPTQENVKVDLGQFKNDVTAITVYNIVGDVILNMTEFNGKEIQLLNLENASSGVLLIKISAGNQVVTKRIMKL